MLDYASKNFIQPFYHFKFTVVWSYCIWIHLQHFTMFLENMNDSYPRFTWNRALWQVTPMSFGIATSGVSLQNIVWSKISFMQRFLIQRLLIKAVVWRYSSISQENSWVRSLFYRIPLVAAFNFSEQEDSQQLLLGLAKYILKILRQRF